MFIKENKPEVQSTPTSPIPAEKKPKTKSKPAAKAAVPATSKPQKEKREKQRKNANPKKAKDAIAKTQNASLLNIISPQGLKFNRTSVDISDSNATFAAISKLPNEVEVGWLSKITNCDGALVCIGITPLNSGGFTNILSKNIANQRSIESTAVDALKRIRAEQSADNSELLMKQIDQNNESIVTMSVTIGAITQIDEDRNDSFDGKNDVYRGVESTVTTTNAQIKKVAFRQETALQQCTPTFAISKEIQKNYGFITPIRSMVGGFPWSTSSFTDMKGSFFGKSITGNVIMLNPWLRGGDRVNSNYVLLGKSGLGKSTITKHIMVNEFVNRTKQIVIDPESEYHKICASLGGDLIKAGGRSKAMINPLQIRPAPIDEDDEEIRLYSDEGNGIGDMAMHIKTLEVFISLYLPSLSEIQKAMFKIYLIELYQSFGISWDTSIKGMKPTDFPIFSDLYNLICKKIEEKPQDENLNILKVLLHDIALGADSFIWNGHTTLSSDSDFICLDTHSLQDTSENVKRAQYFNLLSWCWQKLSANREERYMLYCDEAYLMIDPKVPQSLVFLRNVVKRSRKYEAGVAIISHSVIDFLDESIKMYGQALLDMPCFKIIMGMDGESFNEVKKLYNLTTAEEQLILEQKRGTALCFFGSKRIGVNFDLRGTHQYQLELMGAVEKTSA